MMMMMEEMSGEKRRSHHHQQQHHHHHHDVLVLTNAQTKKLKTRGSSPSPKEKKDKIGERVAALQQLVSPFGKTDTATVLQEATGYINFLHDQLQVLSAPYLRTGPQGNMQVGDECGSDGLRRRGLCLMPVTSALKIAQSNGADLWAPAVSSSK